jgi:hypothetical protein
MLNTFRKMCSKSLSIYLPKLEKKNRASGIKIAVQKYKNLT